MSKKDELLEVLQSLQLRLKDSNIIEHFNRNIDEFDIELLQTKIKECVKDINSISNETKDLDLSESKTRAERLLSCISDENFNIKDFLQISYHFIINSSCIKERESKFFQYLIDERGYAFTAFAYHKLQNRQKYSLLLRDIHKNYLAIVNIKLIKGEFDLPDVMADTKYKGALELFLIMYNIENNTFKCFRMTKSDGFEKLDDFPTYEELQSYRETSMKKIAIPTQVKLRQKSDTRPVLGVKSIAKSLSSIIRNYPEESGMMIGVFGNWGRGKTFLTEETWKAIVEEDSNYKKVSFSAWKYQDTKESWAYLYEVFMQSYLKDSFGISLDFLKNKYVFYYLSIKRNKKYIKTVKYNNKIEKLEEKLNHSEFLKWIRNSRFYKLIKLNLNKFGWTPVLLFILGAMFFFTLGKLTLFQSLVSTFGLVIVLKVVAFYFLQKTTAIELYRKYFLKSDFKNYLGLQAEIERELSLLLETWLPDKVWSTRQNHDEKIVLFVDDIDRCDFEQIISIIDGLRVILDNEEIHKRLIIVLAIDDKMLEKAFKEKYKKLGFGDEEDLNERYQEYLEKIFIIGIKLNELSADEIKDFAEEFLPKYKEIEEKIIINPETTMWKKGGKKDDIENKICLEATPAKYKRFPRIIEDTDFKTNEKEYSFVKYETISKEVDGKVKIEKIIAKDYIVEITEEERLYLLDVITDLNNATPRRIKIFYYQLLLAKQLLYIRLNEKELLKKWNLIANEKFIIDALIKKKNGEMYEFKQSKLIEQELHYVLDMVIVI